MKCAKFVAVAAALICLLQSCYGFPTGSPTTGTVCTSMLPDHRNSAPQNSLHDYFITTKKSGGNVLVTLMAKGGERFRGFLVQARDASAQDVIINGNFTQHSSESQSATCGETANFWTHTSKTDKISVKSVWVPPPAFSGNIIFRATVVKTFTVFWAGVQSSPLYVVSDQNKDDDMNLRPLRYRDCDKTKSCFGEPDSCIRRGRCNILLTYSSTQDAVKFELYGKVSPSISYVAMAISEDQVMGGDSVTSCILNNNNDARVEHSWNVPGIKRNNFSPGGFSSGASEESAKFEDGDIYCTWRRQHNFTVEGYPFNMKSNNYYFLLASGPVDSRGDKRKHTSYKSSRQPVNLTSVQVIETADQMRNLIKVHGSFMVIAWIGFVSIAILMARYYKQAWGEKTMGSVKIWFAFHRGLMLTSVILIIISFIIIFVFRGGWSYVEPNPHAILGVICTALSIIQPIGALFRPSPESSKRPIFNWLHWLGGNVAHILAIITIFFAASLSSAQLPDGFYWTMVVFVVGHVIAHLILQAHSLKLEKKKSNEVKMMEIGAQNANAAANKDTKEAPGSKFRKLMLGIYCIFISILVLALIILICK